MEKEIKKPSKKELNNLKKYVKIHDKICQTCDGCRKDRCSFTEGYKRGQKEMRDEFRKLLELPDF